MTRGATKTRSATKTRGVANTRSVTNTRGVLPTKIKLLDYQREDVMCSARFTWSNWSRQTGKSFSKSLRRIHRGLKRQRNQLFLSGSQRQSDELMRKVRDHIKAYEVAARVISTPFLYDPDIKQTTIEVGGIRIIGLPANPDTVRGFTGDVFLDEFSVHKDDAEIWAAVFPSVLRGEGELDVAGTPKGRGNMFYRLASNPKFHKSTVTLPQAIEQGLEADAEEMREGIGDEYLYRQEFLCEFLDEAAVFLTYELITSIEDVRIGKAIDWDVLKNGDGEIDCYMGIDVARHRDLTVIWLWARRRGDKRLRTIGVVEMRDRPFREQIEVVDEILTCKAVRRCCVDATGLGMQFAETLEERWGSYRIEPITFATGIKAEMAGKLRIKAEARDLMIPADDDIRKDWHSIKRIPTASGQVRFDAERTKDGHGDRFWAAALGIQAAGDEFGGPIEVMTAGKVGFARDGVW